VALKGTDVSLILFCLDSGQKGSRMINPTSQFILGWTLLTALMLSYTAIVTPPVISYGWMDPSECTPG
jgi:hypothetical protein